MDAALRRLMTLDGFLAWERRQELRYEFDGIWRKRIAGWNGDWQGTIHDRAMHSASPVNPQRPFFELSPRLPDRVILTSGSGSCANWHARDIKRRRGMMASLSAGLDGHAWGGSRTLDHCALGICHAMTRMP